MIALVTGGAASGKSEYAESLACRWGDGPRIYLATMEARDGESLSRVDRHRRARAGKGFCTVECPRDLERLSIPSGSTGKILAELEHLLERAAHLVVVSGEVFSQPAPEGMEAYLFALGTLHRELARRADLVVESVYGIPVYGKCPKGWME